MGMMMMKHTKYVRQRGDCTHLPGGHGGITPFGCLLVNANTLAAAMLSACTLNSASGVILPGTSMAPPIMTISFTLSKVSTSSAAARAIFVIGPSAAMVMVLGGCSFSRRSISLCAGTVLGVKLLCWVAVSESEAGSAGT